MARIIKCILTALLLFMLSAYVAVFAADTKNRCLANFNQHIINPATAWFDDCDLYDRDLPIIISYLNQHPEISQLHLLSNHISDKGALLLSKLKIDVLELGKNQISRKGAVLLMHSAIPMLDLHGNKINVKNLSQLSENKADFSPLISGDKMMILT